MALAQAQPKPLSGLDTFKAAVFNTARLESGSWTPIDKLFSPPISASIVVSKLVCVINTDDAVELVIFS